MSYYLNKLQRLDTAGDYIVTLNPDQPPAREQGAPRASSSPTPSVSQESLATHSALPRLQGQRRTYFCGAYLGWGFHEDGLVSAIRVAEMLGVRFG